MKKYKVKWSAYDLAWLVYSRPGNPRWAFTTKPEAMNHARVLNDWDRDMRAEKGARKNPTKAQKREKAKRAAAKNRVAVALAKFLKQANPAMKTTGATVTRLKGGGFTIRPIKAVKRGRR